MSGILSLLLRQGAGALLRTLLQRRMFREAGGLVAFYAVLTVLALAALAFLYILLYQWLSRSLDGIAAAGILCGANLLLIVLALIGKTLLRSRRKAPSLAGGLGDPNIDAGIALGLSISRELRKASPQVALAAAVIGLIIGARPELLNLLRRSPPKDDSHRQNRR